jgi:predicted SnoaL-like aldol condensation-catalyzing enzyme
MTEKEIAISFLNLAGTGKVQKAFKEFVSADFFHHNQYFNGSREALEKAMEEAHASSPNKSIEIKFSYKEGKTVITHSLVTKKDVQIAVVHIFRFEKDQIVEMWDISQPISKDSPNEYGMF